MPERENSERRSLQLEVTAWSLCQPARLLHGTTVDLGSDAALVRLPGLDPAAARLEIRIALPERALLAHADIVDRDAPDLVDVTFDWVDEYERGRLLAFVRSAR